MHRFRLLFDLCTKAISNAKNLRFDLVVSPNGKLMAYERYGKETNTLINTLIVEDAVGVRQSSIPWKKEWDYIADWLNNENLLIGTTPESDKSTTGMSSTFIVFNPFSGESQILKPDFPNIYINDSIAANWSGWRETVYNQNLDRVVYLQGGPAGDGAFHYILRDLSQQINLRSFKTIGGTSAIPRWSLDGNEFVFSNSQTEDIQAEWPSYELYSVSRNGKVTRLTDLTKYYPWVYIEDYSWSPDGKYVAFWFSWWSDENRDWRLQGQRYLAVVDAENSEVTNYCIAGKPANNGRVRPPVWSPDGKQIAVESVSAEGKSQVVLIDLAQQSAIQIGEDMTPIGWMK